MTTFDPGASVVFTHGFVASPRSTAFLASSAAPIITDGFDVLVQLVMAAITTWPWSSSNSVPLASFTGTRFIGRGDGGGGTSSKGESGAPAPVIPFMAAGGSLAGNDSADASS